MSTKPVTVKREITRSRTGCWTCRTRRKKCDEARPACRTCVGLGLVCEGYGVRLKWAAHRKSRVTFNHSPREGSARASKSPKAGGSSSSSRESPETLENSPGASNSPGVLNARDEQILEHLGLPLFSALSKLEREALYEFADWGAATLGAGMSTGPDHIDENLAGCADSWLMALNCVTYQITLDPKYARYADQYYCRSLEEFRRALSVANSLDDESTSFAGLLLCSISMNRAMPWTIHLNGITSMLREHGKFQTFSEQRHEIMGLIGTMDLPTHILGRQNEHLHVWYDHCRDQPGIEDEVTGLPHNLVDILSSVMHPGIEERLLQWKPDVASDATMYKVWDTVRYAGIIAARDFAPGHEPMTLLCESAVHYVLLRLRELDYAIKDRNLNARRALLFPLVAAGSKPSLLTPSDKDYITSSILVLSDGDGGLYHRQVIVTLTEYWDYWASDGRVSLQQFARDKGRELGLF